MDGADQDTNATRRRFLQMACAAAAVGAGCSSAGASPDPIGNVDGGALQSLPVGTLRPVGSQAVCIGRDDSGVYAMTLTCTHAGCNIAINGTVSAQGIACACHGSRFDVNGSVVQGPASEPLQHYAVTQDAAGELTIHGGSEVDAATRLKV